MLCIVSGGSGGVLGLAGEERLPERAVGVDEDAGQPLDVPAEQGGLSSLQRGRGWRGIWSLRTGRGRWGAAPEGVDIDQLLGEAALDVGIMRRGGGARVIAAVAGRSRSARPRDVLGSGSGEGRRRDQAAAIRQGRTSGLGSIAGEANGSRRSQCPDSRARRLRASSRG